MTGRIKYGPMIRAFDETATADGMQACADGYRRSCAQSAPSDPDYYDCVAEAGYCQSLADRKRKGKGAS